MYTIVGIRDVNYTSKTGKQVVGVELHCIEEDKRVQGYATEKLYLSEGVLNDSGLRTESFKLDGRFECTYNKYGKIAQVKLYDAEN